MVERSSEEFNNPSEEIDKVKEINRLVDSAGHHIGHFLLGNRFEEETDIYTDLGHLQTGLKAAISLNELVKNEDLKEIIDILQSIEGNSRRDDELLDKINSLMDNLHNIKE